MKKEKLMRYSAYLDELLTDKIDTAISDEYMGIESDEDILPLSYNEWENMESDNASKYVQDMFDKVEIKL